MFQNEKIVLGGLIGLIILLVLANVFTGIFLFQKFAEQSILQQQVRQLLSGSEEVDAEVIDGDLEETNLNTGDELNVPTEVVTGDSIQVTWQEFPVHSQVFDLIPYSFFENEKNYVEDDWFSVYWVGSVESGKYEGAKIYILTQQPDGPAFRDNFYRILVDGKDKYILTKYSDEYYDWSGDDANNWSKYFSEADITISNLNSPNTIKIPGTGDSLIKTVEEPKGFLSNKADLEKLFKYDEDNYVYRAPDGCFFVKAQDGTAREYYFETQFMQNSRSGGLFGPGEEVLDITWLDGSKNTAAYMTSYVGSCGGGGCYNIQDYANDGTYQFEKIGTTKQDGDIYAIEVSKAINLEDKSEHPLKNAYLMYYPGYDNETEQQLEKISFADFLKDRPVIYWKDSFGKYIEMRNAKYAPAVECAKPVVYLYPEKNMDVRVMVEPNGGLKVSDPAYNGGWYVNASTSGTLFNYTDSKSYPYLFWEGFGYDYQRPSQGFVVAKENVDTKLRELLTRLGLVGVEIDDFMEFWLPKMQEDPYYFITFLPQAEFEAIAPLTVEPKPDKVIRVFMDYKGLDKFEQVEPLNITTPKRIGFTVVEWGGALHK